MLVSFSNKSSLISFAGVNHWVSTLNDRWSLDMMVYMHEIGHNLSLGHAYLTDNSGDYSSYMSATGWAPNLNGPLKCFNGASNSKLGWFSDRAEELDLMNSGLMKLGAKVNLAAFSEVGRPDDTDPALIKVGPYSLQYNYASEYNSGTEILRNTVTVSHAEPGKTVVHKEGLVPGGAAFVKTNFEGTGKTLRIDACERVSGNSFKPTAMKIGISLGQSGSPCDLPDTPPTTTTPATTTTTSTTTSSTTTTTTTKATTPATTTTTTTTSPSTENKPTCPNTSGFNFVFWHRGKPRRRSCRWLAKRRKRPNRLCGRKLMGGTSSQRLVSDVCRQECAHVTQECEPENDDSSSIVPTPPLDNGNKPTCPNTSQNVVQLVKGRRRPRVKTVRCQWIGQRINRKRKFCGKKNLLANGETIADTCQDECASVTKTCNPR